MSPRVAPRDECRGAVRRCASTHERVTPFACSRVSTLLSSRTHGTESRRRDLLAGGGRGRGCACNSTVDLTTPHSASEEPSTEVGGPRVGAGEGNGAVHADRAGVGVVFGVGVGAEEEET
jgi:hypothetical protein